MSEYKAKMVAVVRKELKMRRGKEISQGGHGWIMAYKYADHSDPAFIEWDTHSFAKITAFVNTEEEILDIYTKAKEKGMNAHLVIDSGRTEFHGNKTLTFVVIGPHWNEDFEGITSELKLY